MYAGESVALVNTVLPASDLVRSLAEGTEALLKTAQLADPTCGGSRCHGCSSRDELVARAANGQELLRLRRLCSILRRRFEMCTGTRARRRRARSPRDAA